MCFHPGSLGLKEHSSQFKVQGCENDNDAENAKSFKSNSSECKNGEIPALAKEN